MKRLLLALVALFVVLAACQDSLVPAESEQEHPEYTYAVEEYEPEPPAPPLPPEEPPTAPYQPRPAPPPPPTNEDYIKMMYALQHAFATGEFGAFIEAYPGPIDGGIGTGPFVNEWPALLEGVTAEMTFSEEDVANNRFDDWGLRPIAIELYVSGGNIHLPSGKQTLELKLSNNRETGNTPSIVEMVLTTDGRDFFSWRWRDILEEPTLEEQLLLIVGRLEWQAGPLGYTITFLNVFENEEDWGEFTYDEIVAGAKKFLGLVGFSPTDVYLWGESEQQLGRSELVYRHNDRYGIVGMGIKSPPRSMLVLDTPNEGDITVRAFAYENHFLFAVREVIDYNFLILQGDDGTPYARLLSEQTVPWA